MNMSELTDLAAQAADAARELRQFEHNAELIAELRAQMASKIADDIDTADDLSKLQELQCLPHDVDAAKSAYDALFAKVFPLLDLDRLHDDLPLRLYQKFHQYEAKPGSTFIAWLKQVSTNLYRDDGRRKSPSTGGNLDLGNVAEQGQESTSQTEIESTFFRVVNDPIAEDDIRGVDARTVAILLFVSGLEHLATQSLRDSYVRICPCLLYTSPSPRDLSTSRMPSSA